MSIRIVHHPEGALFEGRGPWGVQLTDALPLEGAPAFKVPEPLRILDRLLMDEQASLSDGDVLVPFETLYDLEPFERVDLGLQPGAQKVSVTLRAQGYPGPSGDLSIRGEVRLGDGSVLTSTDRKGGWVRDGSEWVMVAEPVRRLLARLDAGPGETLESHHLLIAEVKQLAADAGAELDKYLANQHYLLPRSIGVDVEVQAPDHVILRPAAEGIDEAFDRFTEGPGPTRTSYVRREGTKRTRMVLSKGQRETVDELRKTRELRGADVPRFFENPEAFLPDEIDLAQFSERVRGLIPQRYRSHPYLSIRGEKDARDWFEVSPEIELQADSAAGPTPWDPEEEGSDPAPSPPGAAPPAPDAPHISPERYAELCEEVIATGESHVLHEGAWITIEPERAKQFLEAMEEVERDENGGWRMPADRVPYVLDVISNLDALEFAAGDAVPAPSDHLPDPPDYPFPTSLDATLRPYQEFGYRWLRYLHEKSYGGLLADDMGLGKTVQVIALLAYLAESDALRPTLLVVPNSLVPNWKRELARFCPSIRAVHEHHGADRRRNAAFLAQWDVVITTYGTLRRDQLELAKVDWQVVACDEAQNVKNPTAQVTSAVKAMKAPVRLALTGTPVENGLSELWCIVDFVQPGKLGSWADFRDDFERPLIQAAPEDLFKAAQGLQAALDPHYVRRTKRDVLDGLPKKSEERYRVDLGETQRALYARIIRDVQSGEVHPLAGLQRLIQLCSHPAALFDGPGRFDPDADDCPKLNKTLEILRGVQARGEKALLFSRYRRMQDILQRTLSEQFGIVAPILNGESAGRLRQQRVDAFNQAPGFGAMILSPEAAGVGLNITGANHVIHYTRLWNPAKERQATDRAHRLGQTRPVTVHYPIVVGDTFMTVEEHLDTLLAEKADLADNVLWPRESLSVAKDLQRILQGAA